LLFLLHDDLVNSIVTRTNIPSIHANGSPILADRKFIQWAEQCLSNGKADPCQSRGLSFKNCMLRVPGSINSKNGSQVKIIQRWDGTRPFTNWILRDFRRCLIQRNIKPEKERMTAVYSTNWDKRMSTGAG
jgi:hypothetical protein